MNIKIRVITNSKHNKITVSDDNFRVYTTSVPEDGKANESIIKLLAKHFDVSKSKIKIIRGEISKDKIISIEE